MKTVRVHIMYRAIGETDVSVLGYASSSDGFMSTNDSIVTVYIPRETFEGANAYHPYSSEMSEIYASGGGGAGGCEDPRLTESVIMST